MKIGLQLYTVKECCHNDFFTTLEHVAKMGYDGVEFAGYYGYSAKEIKDKLDELGLKVAGSHIQADLILNHLDEVIAFEKEIGNEYIICPWAKFESDAEWVSFFEALKVASEKIELAGLKLVYHNHNQEFDLLDGRYILDTMLEEVPLLYSELDTYWSEFAGIDTTSWMKKYSGRLPLLHLKDMHVEKRESTILGAGCLSIDRFIGCAKEVGTKWLIVEQEAFDQDPLVCVEIGLQNLKKLL